MKKDMTTAASDAPRTWNSGPPPHVGWWNASACHIPDIWRWWDGIQWSDESVDHCKIVAPRPYRGSRPILWTDYWPEGARVPRVDPADPYIMPLLPGLNAGNPAAWFLAGHLSPHPAEQDEDWRAISTGQRTGDSRPQNPEPRDLTGVSTRDLMTELFRRVG